MFSAGYAKIEAPEGKAFSTHRHVYSSLSLLHRYIYKESGRDNKSERIQIWIFLLMIYNPLLSWRFRHDVKAGG